MTECKEYKDIIDIIETLKHISKCKTDRELAVVFDVDPFTISNWKNQAKQIPIDKLICFCDEFNASLDEILRSVNIPDTFRMAFFSTLDIDILSQTKHFCDIASEYIKVPHGVIPSRDEQKRYFSLLIQDNELSKTAPKGSTVFIDCLQRKIKTYPQMYLIVVNGTRIFRNLFMTLTNKICLQSENINVGDVIYNIEEVLIIGKLEGVLKWKE